MKRKRENWIIVERWPAMFACEPWQPRSGLTWCGRNLAVVCNCPPVLRICNQFHYNYNNNSKRANYRQWIARSFPLTSVSQTDRLQLPIAVWSEIRSFIWSTYTPDQEIFLQYTHACSLVVPTALSSFWRTCTMHETEKKLVSQA